MLKKIGFLMLFFYLFLSTDGVLANELVVENTEQLTKSLSQAQNGDIIKLKQGEYQGNFIIKKSIQLIGEKNVKIIGPPKGSVITIEADDVRIEGLYIEGGGSQDSGIYVKGNRASIINNVLADVFHGIYVRGSYGSRILENQITSFIDKKKHKGFGIYLIEAPNSVIQQNYIYNTQDGVYVSYSDYCEVRGNLMKKTRYGVHTMDSRSVIIAQNNVRESVNGLMIMQSYEIHILENVFYLNTTIDGAGMFIYDTFDSKISTNVMKGNITGIILENAQRNIVEFNAFIDNDTGLELGKNSSANLISFNNFYQNTRQIISDQNNENLFNRDGYGNYYDDHGSTNLNEDQIIDYAYKSGDIFYNMTSKEPLLQLFFQSPAVQLWNTIEKYTPIPAEQFIIDESPLAKPSSIQLDVLTNQDQKKMDERNSIVFIIFFIFVIISSGFIFIRMGGRKNEI